MLVTASGSGAPVRAIAEPWASRPLGSGISIARRAPAASISSDTSPSIASAAGSAPLASADEGDFETLEDLERGQEVRLAVFMPDGSALVGDDVFLNDKSGRCGRLSVNPWSGLPMFVRLANLAAQQSDASGVADVPGEMGGDASTARPLSEHDYGADANDDDSVASEWNGEGYDADDVDDERDD